MPGFVDVVAMGQLRHGPVVGLHADTVGDQGQDPRERLAAGGLLPRLPRDEPTQRELGLQHERADERDREDDRGPARDPPRSDPEPADEPVHGVDRPEEQHRREDPRVVELGGPQRLARAEEPLGEDRQRDQRIRAREAPGTPWWPRRSTAACRSSSPGSGTRAPCRSGPVARGRPHRTGSGRASRTSSTRTSPSPRTPGSPTPWRRGSRRPPSRRAPRPAGASCAAARSRRPSGRARPCPRARAAARRSARRPSTYARRSSASMRKARIGTANATSWKSKSTIPCNGQHSAYATTTSTV